MTGTVVGGDAPLEGREAQGRIEPHRRLVRRPATDFHGGKSPEGERGSVERKAGGTVRADARRAGLTERCKAVPWKGKPSKSVNPMSVTA
jgi:hypothetical protein